MPSAGASTSALESWAQEEAKQFQEAAEHLFGRAQDWYQRAQRAALDHHLPPWTCPAGIGASAGVGVVLLGLSCRAVCRRCRRRRGRGSKGAMPAAAPAPEPQLGTEEAVAAPELSAAKLPMHDEPPPTPSRGSSSGGRSPSICPAGLQSEEPILDLPDWKVETEMLQAAAKSAWRRISSGSAWLASSMNYKRTNSMESRTDLYERTASVRYEKTHSERNWMEHYQALEGGPKTGEGTVAAPTFFQRLSSLLSLSARPREDGAPYLRTDSMAPTYERTHTQGMWQEHSETLERRFAGA